jgi:hypothetical protein
VLVAAPIMLQLFVSGSGRGVKEPRCRTRQTNGSAPYEIRTRGNSLFAPRQRGGVIGGLGYNFQDAYIITVLPQWLADPDFQSFIKEGFEDVDVVFAGESGTRVRHYQLKDHEVTLSEFREVLLVRRGRRDPRWHHERRSGV